MNRRRYLALLLGLTVGICSYAGAAGAAEPAELLARSTVSTSPESGATTTSAANSVGSDVTTAASSAPVNPPRARLRDVYPLDWTVSLTDQPWPSLTATRNVLTGFNLTSTGSSSDPDLLILLGSQSAQHLELTYVTVLLPGPTEPNLIFVIGLRAHDAVLVPGGVLILLGSGDAGTTFLLAPFDVIGGQYAEQR